jgi:hypothetical protein
LYTEFFEYKKALEADNVKWFELVAKLTSQFFLLEELAVAYSNWDNIEYFFLNEAGTANARIANFFRSRGFGMTLLSVLGVVSSGISTALSMGHLSKAISEQKYFMAIMHGAKTMSSAGLLTVLLGSMANRRQVQIVTDALDKIGTAGAVESMASAEVAKVVLAKETEQLALQGVVNATTDKEMQGILMRLGHNYIDRVFSKKAMTVASEKGIELAVDFGMKTGLRRVAYGSLLLLSQPWIGATVFTIDLLIGFYIAYYIPGELESFVATTPFALKPPLQPEPEMLLLLRFAALTFRPQARLIRVNQRGDYKLQFSLPFFDANKHKIRVRISYERLFKYNRIIPQSAFVNDGQQYKLLTAKELKINNNIHTQINAQLRLARYDFNHQDLYRITIDYQIVIEDNITFPIKYLSNDDPQVTELKARKRLQYNLHRLEDSTQACHHPSDMWYQITPFSIWRDPQDVNKYLDDLKN